MANSIKEYIAGTNADGTTYTIGPSFTYPTPDYLEGRGDTDIVVYVDDILQSSDKYTVNGTALNFDISALPSVGARIQIKRTSSRDQRLTDYTDGALLNAETLDKDSDQLFYMAQEALDTSNYVNIGSSQFYYSQGEPPENPKLGTLWYHLNNHANELKVWDGNEWSLATPVKETRRYTKDDFTEVAGDTDKLENVEMNSSSEVFLNGVKLIRGATYSEVVTDETADYWYDANQYQMLWTKDLAADDILEIVTFTGGYATTVAEAEARIQQLVADAEDYKNQTVDINFDLNSDFGELIQFVSNPEDQSFVFQDVIHFSALHHAAKAAASASDASTSLLYAQKYASNPKDAQFTDPSGNTGYSALHYSEVSKAHAESVGNVVSDAQGHADNAGVAQGHAETAQGHAETAQGKAEDAQTAAEVAMGAAQDAQGLAEAAQGVAEGSLAKAEAFATSDTVFDHNGEQKYSAKYYADQVTNDIQGITDVVNAADDLAVSLQSSINNPAHHLVQVDADTSFYSARHYAEVAEAYSNQAVDSLIGWDLVDSNTISTITDGTPVFHSSTTLDLKASSAVRANDVELPAYGGNISLSNQAVRGLKGLSVSNVGSVYTITFPEAYGFTSEYQVMATYNGNNKALVKVNKSTDSFTVEACKYDDGYALDTGDIVITVYKFT